MYNVPMIRIELDGIKQAVRHMFAANNDEFQKLLQEKIEETITEEWVKNEITHAVYECIKNAVRDIPNSYNLKHKITNIISDTISEKLG